MTAVQIFLRGGMLYIQNHFIPQISLRQTHIVAKEWVETLTDSARAWLSEQWAALAHYTHTITWPFPQWMGLIRSHWRSHWVCNCFPLGEMLTAIELHLTAEFADECCLSTEWSRLILLWGVREKLHIWKSTHACKDDTWLFHNLVHFIVMCCTARMLWSIVVPSKWHQTFQS